jgi:predicted DNA-binding protein with PD1-like motif
MDLRRALESTVAERSCNAAFVASGIGSLRQACLRLAGATEPRAFDGDMEILTLAGTIASNGSHLHMSMADAQGRVFGGHVAYGCRGAAAHAPRMVIHSRA